MRFGLSQHEYELLENLVVKPLRERGAVVWCFGSRARGTQHKFSDIDLMVDTTTDLSPLIAQLVEDIVESHFPYKVDIVQRIDFAQSYLSGYERDKVEY